MVLRGYDEGCYHGEYRASSERLLHVLLKPAEEIGFGLRDLALHYVGSLSSFLHKEATFLFWRCQTSITTARIEAG